jgi:hypothetical protein
MNGAQKKSEKREREREREKDRGSNFLEWEEKEEKTLTAEGTAASP